MRSRTSTESQASGKLAEAEIMFWQGYYPRSYDEAQQVIKQYPSSESAIEAHRLAGDNAFWRDPPDYAKAGDEYRAYLARKKTGLLADGVRRSLASALESQAAALQLRGSPEAGGRVRAGAPAFERPVGERPRP